jgi:hypothetical protein
VLAYESAGHRAGVPGIKFGPKRVRPCGQQKRFRGGHSLDAERSDLSVKPVASFTLSRSATAQRRTLPQGQGRSSSWPTSLRFEPPYSSPQKRALPEDSWQGLSFWFSESYSVLHGGPALLPVEILVPHADRVPDL